MIRRNARFSLRRCWYLVPACLSVGFLLISCGGGGASVGGSSSTGSVHSAVLPTVATPSAVFSSQPSAIIGAGSQTMPTATSTMTPAAVPVKLNYVLPTQAATSSIASRSVMSASTTRQLQYISTGNTLISITVTPLGGAGTTYGPTACTSGACTISFTATPGPNTIAFTLTDGTNTLSKFSTTTIVQPTTENTLNFTANPVVNSVSLSLASASVNAGTATNDLLTVTATDAANRTIVGNSKYVDVNGNPVAFTLSVQNAQAGGRGTVNIQGPARITAPGQAAIYAHYDGKWLASSTISVTSTSSAVTSLSGVTLPTVPTVTEYNVISSGFSLGITTGADGNLWVTNFGSTVFRVNTQGVATPFTIPGASGVIGIASGPDGNLWLADLYASNAKVINTSGQLVKTIAMPHSEIQNYVTAGPDGSMWFTSHNQYIIKATMNGTVTDYNVGTVGSLGIVSGSDGNLWFTDCCGNDVGKITTAGVSTIYTTGISGGSYMMVAGPDGNLWVPENGNKNILRVTTNGTVSSFPLGTDGSSFRDTGAVGPDGNLWFGDLTANDFIRVNPSNGALIGTYGSGQLTGGAYNITIGPDGNLWFTENNSVVGKFVL